MRPAMSVQYHQPYPRLAPVEYPASDGKPMAETDLHRDEMLALIDTLREHFREDALAYVAGNNFIYYQEGNPCAVFSPDTYVVFGVEKKQRRTYKLWEERRVPAFVMEMSSQRTYREDVGKKKQLCARLGVAEYWLYDPEADVVRPPLKGFRLVPGSTGPRYHPIAPQRDGSLPSMALGVLFKLEKDYTLRCLDAATRTPLQRPQEARAAARQRDVVVRQRDELARQHDELARQRDELARQRDELARQLDASRRLVAQLKAGAAHPKQ